MPPRRVPISGFIGGTTALRAAEVSNMRLINFMLETDPEGGGQYIKHTPGSRDWSAALPGGADTSGLCTIGGRGFVVCGTSFCEVGSNGAVLLSHTVAYDPNRRATVVSDGFYVVTCAGGHVYWFKLSDNTFGEATDFAGIDIRMVEYIDSYFLALEHNSRKVFLTLSDPTTWDIANDFFIRVWGGDNISFIKRAGRQLLVIGTDTGEFYNDTGDATIPFQPTQSAFLDIGSASPWAAASDGDSVIWLSNSIQGGREVVKMAEYTPVRVTTAPIVGFLDAQDADPSSAEGFVVNYGGHLMYRLNVPGSRNGTTLVYDFAEKVWSELGILDAVTGEWSPHPVRNHIYMFDKHLIAQRDSNRLYELTWEVYTEVIGGDVVEMTRDRVFKFPWPNYQVMDIARIELAMNSGNGLEEGQGSAPLVRLAFSSNNGLSYNPFIQRSSGALGESDRRIIVDQIGRVRAPVVLLRVSDPVPWYFLSCTADVIPISL